MKNLYLITCLCSSLTFGSCTENSDMSNRSDKVIEVNIENIENSYSHYSDLFEIGAAGEILKFADVHFVGGVSYTADFEYSCCNGGGGYCSKEYPKCTDVSAWDLITG